MVSLHYFRRLCSPGRVMPEVYLRYLHLLTNSSIPSRRGGLLTLLSRPVGTSESHCDSFCESWLISKGFSGPSLRTVLFSLSLFSESSRVLFRKRSNASKSGVQHCHHVRCFQFLTQSLALRPLVLFGTLLQVYFLRLATLPSSFQSRGTACFRFPPQFLHRAEFLPKSEGFVFLSLPDCRTSGSPLYGFRRLKCTFCHFSLFPRLQIMYVTSLVRLRTSNGPCQGKKNFLDFAL